MPFKVTDLCCTPGVKRTHDLVVDGRKIPYTFEYLTPLEMPETHARKLVPIVEGFEVTDEKGNRILPSIPVTKGYGGVEKLIADNECVARLEELTLEALLERAWVLPGGEKLTRQDGKVAIAAFISQVRKKAEQARLGKPDNGTDDMSEREITDFVKEAA